MALRDLKFIGFCVYSPFTQHPNFTGTGVEHSPQLNSNASTSDLNLAYLVLKNNHGLLFLLISNTFTTKLAWPSIPIHFLKIPTHELGLDIPHLLTAVSTSTEGTEQIALK